MPPPVELSSAYKQVTWVDFDNDGDKDLFCTGEFVPLRLFENTGNFSFQEITVESGLPQETSRSNGHCWGDYNKDGHLDLFICNYDQNVYPNWLYQNNGDGTFTNMTEEQGLDSHLEFSFQSVFLDYNSDGWQDLLVINDKTLHPNRLYKNENGVFMDVTSEAGLNYFTNSMSNTVADFNNDSHQDIFISDANNNLLHKNNGDGTFEEIAQTSGISDLGFTWGGLFVDVNNNKFLDLVICSSKEVNESGKNYLLMNGESESFILNPTSGLGNQLNDTYCPVKGDLNNDGFSDVFITAANGDPSLIMRNLGNGGSYLKLSLKGVISNMDGIGSRIDFWCDSVRQTKYTHCGEGYLGQNSNTMIFGLGESLVVDSLKVTWLSGVEDYLYNLSPNQTIELIEGSTLNNQITVDGETNFCHGDSVTLFAGNFESYLWSNGDTTSSVTVHDSGEFSVLVTDEFGFEIQADTISINSFPNPIISPQVDHVDCHGFENGSILLENLSGVATDSCLWSNGENDLWIDSLAPGLYTYDYTDINGCFANGSISVSQPEMLEINVDVTDQVDDEAGSAMITVDGGTPPYFIFWSNGAVNETSQDSLTTGFYAVWIKDFLGCKAQSLFYIEFIQSALSQEALELKFYPNPVTNFLTIESLTNSPSSVQLRQIDGKLIMDKKLPASNTHSLIDFRDFPKGVYILSIESGTRLINARLIKK